jgi:MFS family permease
MRPAGRSLALLVGNRNFAALWASDLIAAFGDRIHRVALAALIWHLTGSLMDAGVAFIAAALPELLLGPLAGVAVDRWNRRTIMIVSDLARIAPVLLLPILAPVSLWLVYVLLFLLNTASILHRPAKVSSIPSVVPAPQLTAANSFSSMVESVGDLAGYPLAGIGVGLLSGWLGTETGLTVAFGGTALTYGLSALILLGLRLPPVERPAGGSIRQVWEELVTGLRFLAQHPVVRVNTEVVLLGPMAAGIAMPLLIGYAYEVIAGGEFAYGMLNFGIGLGSVVGAGGLALLGARRLGTLVIVGLAVMGAAILGLSASSSLWPAVLLMAATGVGNMMVVIPSVTIVHRCTPESLLGRVFAFRSTLIFTALIVANGIGGWAGDAFGVLPVLAVTGAVLVTSAVLAALVPASRQADELAPVASPVPGD